MSKTQEQLFFFKRVSFLISAGYSLYESLIFIVDSGESKNKLQYQKLLARVSEGELFSDSLQSEKIITDRFLLKLIALGEKTGKVSEGIADLIIEIERRKELKSKIISALIYPVCVLLGALALSGGLVFYIFPKVLPIFSSMNVPLPLSTKALIVVITACTSHWLLVSTTGLFLSISFFLKCKKELWRSKSFRCFWFSQIFRTIGAMLRSGLPLDKALYFSASISNQPRYQKSLESFGLLVSEGSQVGILFGEDTRLYPRLIGGFLTSAEKSGSVSNAFLYLADFYAGELSKILQRLTDMIEPVLMIVLGLGIGIIGISLITPMYSLTSNIAH